MRYSTSRELAAYWRALKRGAPLPAARDFDATAVASALRHSLMLVSDARGAHVSEASEALILAARSDPRGARYSDLWAADAQADAYDLLAAPLAGAACLAGLRLATADGEERLCEAVFLPLLRMEERVSIVVLCAFAGFPETPWRFERFAGATSSRILTDAPRPTGFGRLGARSTWRVSYDELCRRAARELGATSHPMAPQQLPSSPAPMIPAGRGGFFVIDGGAASLR
jgi:hypothetical protein